MTQSKIESLKDSSDLSRKFGTFKGVFTPSILTILGVIMFLRMGWVLGHAGLIGTLVIVTIGSGITFLTALSISATATNMRVGGGGAYYMISRSLGVEAGAAVGLPLYLAQSFGIAFYLAGFSESLNALIPSLPVVGISLVGLVLLSLLAWLSADLALKMQFFILTMIMLALVSYFSGGLPESLPDPDPAALAEKVGFWTVFAVFFPAVTGIEAGLSMSGDLKNPAKALPWGTLAAVVSGYFVYLAIPVFMYRGMSPEVLKSHSLIMKDMARWGELIMLGVWGASLSSALGALLGAPRTLQALARDRVVPRVLGKGEGSDDAPRIATLVTFFVALIAILLGDLNTIAPVLSMFFLTSYGMLNFSAAIEGLIANPSWRPEFKTPWYISVAGAFGCFAVMFMIDPGATIISLCLTFGVYYIMQKRKMTAYWGDMRRGILAYLAKFSTERLSRLPMNTKSWRPNVLVLSGAPSRRWYLVELGHAIASRSGFLTVSSILPEGSHAENRIVETQSSVEEYLKNRNVPAFVRISVSSDIQKGMLSLIRDYGLGPITPNTVILGETENPEHFLTFTETLIRTYQLKRNLVVVRVPEHYLGTRNGQHEPEDLKNLNFYFSGNHNKQIDVWWGRQRNNAGLSLALGYLLQMSPSWEGASLNLRSITTDPEEVTAGEELLQGLISESRLDAKPSMYLHQDPEVSIFSRIAKESHESGFVFLGMLPPDIEKFKSDPETVIKEYASYYKNILDQTADFPPVGMVMAAEDLDFHKIFVP